MSLRHQPAPRPFSARERDEIAQDRLHELVQSMVDDAALVGRLADVPLARVPPEFPAAVRRLARALQEAVPLFRRHRAYFESLRDGRTVTIAGFTCKSQTECVLRYTYALLENVAAAIEVARAPQPPPPGDVSEN
jgi:hypothetical protein